MSYRPSRNNVIDLTDDALTLDAATQNYTYEDVLRIDVIAANAYEEARRRVFAVVPHPIDKTRLSESQQETLAQLEAVESHRKRVRDAYYEGQCN